LLNYDEAIKEARKGIELAPDKLVYSFLGVNSFYAGRLNEFILDKPNSFTLSSLRSDVLRKACWPAMVWIGVMRSGDTDNAQPT
jgi:hypothetical protein